MTSITPTAPPSPPTSHVDDTLPVDADQQPTNDPHERSFLRRHGLTGLDVWVSFAVVLLTCAYTPFFFTWFWAPRYIVVAAVLAPGVVALLLQAHRRDRAAIAAVALIVWSVISAVQSGAVWASLIGFVGQDTSVVTWAGALGFWAVARSLTGPGRRLLTTVALAALALNGAVAILQMVVPIEDGHLGLLYRRSIGLTVNPIFLGAFMAAAIAIVVSLSARVDDIDRRHWHRGLLALVAGVALAFAGSRVALAGAVIVTLALAWRHRSRRPVLTTSAMALIGFVLGSIAAPRLGGRATASRFIEQSGSGGRRELWEAGWAASLDRPVFGWGLGRFRTAVQEDLSFEYIASLSGTVQSHFDAHNLVVTVVVALGVPGLLLGATFLWFAGRQATGPLAAGAAALAITWLLQPAALMTLPLAAILLGAATTGPGALRHTRGGDHTGGSPHPVVWIVACSVSLTGAAMVAVAEFRLNSAALDRNSAAVAAAADLRPHDPIVSNVAAHSLRAAQSRGESDAGDVGARLEETIAREPTRPLWWTELAWWQGESGDLDGAEASARQALELQPSHPDGWRVLRAVAIERDDPSLLRDAVAALCRLGDDALCPATTGPSDTSS